AAAAGRALAKVELRSDPAHSSSVAGRRWRHVDTTCRRTAPVGFWRSLGFERGAFRLTALCSYRRIVLRPRRPSCLPRHGHGADAGSGASGAVRPALADLASAGGVERDIVVLARTRFLRVCLYLPCALLVYAGQLACRLRLVLARAVLERSADGGGRRRAEQRHADGIAGRAAGVRAPASLCTASSDNPGLRTIAAGRSAIGRPHHVGAGEPAADGIGAVAAGGSARTRPRGAGMIVAWIKFIHVAAIALWSGGLVALPFLYHQRKGLEGEELHRLHAFTRFFYVGLVSPA